MLGVVVTHVGVVVTHAGVVEIFMVVCCNHWSKVNRVNARSEGGQTWCSGSGTTLLVLMSY